LPVIITEQFLLILHYSKPTGLKGNTMNLLQEKKEVKFRHLRLSLDKYYTLTIRERVVLKFINHGYKVSEIADLLSVSPRVVEVHKQNIIDKLS
jgi:DNA-binding NarL/FixJ family response regulator